MVDLAGSLQIIQSFLLYIEQEQIFVLCFITIGLGIVYWLWPWDDFFKKLYFLIFLPFGLLTLDAFTKLKDPLYAAFALAAAVLMGIGVSLLQLILMIEKLRKEENRKKQR